MPHLQWLQGKEMTAAWVSYGSCSYLTEYFKLSVSTLPNAAYVLTLLLHTWPRYVTSVQFKFSCVICIMPWQIRLVFPRTQWFGGKRYQHWVFDCYIFFIIAVFCCLHGFIFVVLMGLVVWSVVNYRLLSPLCDILCTVVNGASNRQDGDRWCQHIKTPDTTHTRTHAQSFIHLSWFRGTGMSLTYHTNNQQEESRSVPVFVPWTSSLL